MSRSSLVSERRPYWGLLRRRPCLVPTWRGWLVSLFVIAAAFMVAARAVHPFLAVTAPITGTLLVVEGWSPDFALAEAITQFERNRYRAVFVTGGPVEKGAPLSEFKTYAEMGAATLVELGLRTNAVRAVPAPAVRQDRTFASAVALKRWLQEHEIPAASINVISSGAHARRTRLLYEKAFGKSSAIGIIAVADPRYDARRWWASSNGFRDVIGEAVAYFYARVIFRPPNE